MLVSCLGSYIDTPYESDLLGKYCLPLSHNFNDLVLEPLFYASAALFLSLLILYFLPEFVYTMWWKYARIYIPVSLLLFMLLVADGGGFGVPSLTPPDGFSMFLSALYLFGFVFFVLVAYARRHK